MSKKDNNCKNRNGRNRSERSNKNNSDGLGLVLNHIQPLTEAQSKVFKYYALDKHVVCYGSAGTGKSMILMYLMLNDLLTDGSYDKILVYRSACQVRSIGFTPGTAEEKIAIYAAGIGGICSGLFGRGDAYEILKRKGLIEFSSTSFARSVTHDNTLVLFEEAQNATFSELSMVATRLGENSKLFLTGDTAQNDLGKNEKSGFVDFIKIADAMSSMRTVGFTASDIVRSSFVKEFLMTKEALGVE